MTAQVTEDDSTSITKPAKGVPQRSVNPKIPMRRKGYIAAVLILAIIGALLSWMGVQSKGSHEVLSLKAAVSRGEAITQENLTSISVGENAPNLIPIDRSAEVVGMKAQTNLFAGTPLVEGSYAQAMPVPENFSIVGLGMKPANLPARELLPGDKVRVVYTPSGDQGAASGELPIVSAIVERFPTASEDAEGNSAMIVDVRVKRSDAPRVAAWSAAGSAGLVLDGEK